MAISPQIDRTSRWRREERALEQIANSRASTNLMIILGMMQVTKRIPFEDENVLNLVRAVYIGSNVLIAALYFYIQLQINKKKGKENISSP
ncbi:hypothetical protein TARUN_179 [Trichoderma arundinaceum]|uniref:Uncharacterized protein n=1 Tax=Trichoderma arundinaceum TaxID=490622 RepID=A0A395P1U9_TRIAR|nr:hypothetical protein TARUN_179 [Trichoderma arundinaceum]